MEDELLPCPIKEVFQKYEHLDTLLSDDRWVILSKEERVNPILDQILFDLWNAIKAYNHSQPPRLVSVEELRIILFPILTELVSGCEIRQQEDVERDDLKNQDRSDLYTKAIKSIHALQLPRPETKEASEEWLLSEEDIYNLIYNFDFIEIVEEDGDGIQKWRTHERDLAKAILTAQRKKRNKKWTSRQDKLS